jgi:transketolase
VRPSWDLFEAQPAAYRASVLGAALRVAIEAAGPFGWIGYVASEDDFIGVPGYCQSRTKMGPLAGVKLGHDRGFACALARVAPHA